MNRKNSDEEFQKAVMEAAKRTKDLQVLLTAAAVVAQKAGKKLEDWTTLCDEAFSDAKVVKSLAELGYV